MRIIIDNNPKIPDRTEAILTKDKSLFPVLVETAKNLERACGYCTPMLLVAKALLESNPLRY